MHQAESRITRQHPIRLFVVGTLRSNSILEVQYAASDLLKLYVGIAGIFKII